MKTTLSVKEKIACNTTLGLLIWVMRRKNAPIVNTEKYICKGRYLLNIPVEMSNKLLALQLRVKREIRKLPLETIEMRRMRRIRSLAV